MRNLVVFLSAFILGALGCKSTEKAVAYTPANIVPTEKSIAWKISGKGLKKPSYLYGTIHMIPKNEFELPGAIREGLDNVRRVTFEIDMKEMTNLGTQMGLISKSFMAGGKTLKDLLSPEDYKLVKDKMAEKGLPAGMFERMKPMFLSSMFSSEEEGPSASSAITSVEMELYKMSKNRRLETAGLETMAFQMSIFDSIPYTVQAQMLVDGLRAVDSTSTEGALDQMLKMYRAQDITAMQAMIGEESGMGQYEDILLKKRNQNWIPIMGRMMAEKPTIFAVGAGHLGGTNGVVSLLRRAGYRVEMAKE